jgi:hypothetical protein
MSSTADHIRELAEACQLMALSTNNAKWTNLAERSQHFADRLEWGDFSDDRPVEENAAEGAPPQRSAPLIRVG